MNRSFTILLCALALFLSCDKPSEIDVPPPPPDTPEQPNPGPDPGPDPNPDPVTPVRTAGPIIVGYATYWDKTMPDPTLLTHINYAFAHIKSDFESLDIKSESRLKQVVALKDKKKDLKVLLSVGGWEAGNFSEMAADETHRLNFCKNCLAAVKNYNLDGIDIDWEYPTSSAAGISSSPQDTRNFTYLVRDLKETLGEGYLVTMASYAGAKYVDFYNATQYMDFVNIMTYDMGKPPYHNAGLYRSSKTKNSCDESVEKHLAAGVPLEKIVLGIPFYGHGDGGAFSKDCVDYRDINTSGYTVMWDKDAMVPYLTDMTGQMVLSYDDEISVGLKADYVLQKGLLGAMYWNIEADDDNWTLSKAIASRLIGAEVEEEEVLVTNPYVEKYMEEVHYPDRDYSYSLILNYPGGGPGEADIPPAVTISWPSAGTSVTVNFWDAEWSRSYSCPATQTSVSVSNLVPGSHYYYMVSTSDGRIVAKGSFKATGMLHQVYFENAVRNGRDLGGWTTTDGKTLRFRKLYRGGRVDKHYMNDAGRAEGLAVGIKAELDLREAEDVPTSSFFGKDIKFLAPGFESGYRSMLRDRAEGVKQCIQFIVQCLREDRPVYFHCAAGRDRTGTIAMLLLGVLGVSEGDIGKDYELTYFSPEDWSMYKGAYHHMRTAEGSYLHAIDYIWNSGTGDDFKTHCENYLVGIGVPRTDIEDLRTIMLK